MQGSAVLGQGWETARGGGQRAETEQAPSGGYRVLLQPFPQWIQGREFGKFYFILNFDFKISSAHWKKVPPWQLLKLNEVGHPPPRRSPAPPGEKPRPHSPHPPTPAPIPWRSSGGLHGHRNRGHVQHDTFICSKVQDIHVYD